MALGDGYGLHPPGHGVNKASRQIFGSSLSFDHVASADLRSSAAVNTPDKSKLLF